MGTFLPFRVYNTDNQLIIHSKFDYGINQVDIPPTVKKIRLDAFALCSQLLDIKIPEGVSNILSGSFIGCSYLTNVQLPSTIDTIGVSVFERCSRLENLYIPASATQIGVSITSNCPNVKIHIDPQIRSESVCSNQFNCYACVRHQIEANDALVMPL